jgi:hypothetical protein
MGTGVRQISPPLVFPRVSSLVGMGEEKGGGLVAVILDVAEVGKSWKSCGN